MAKPQYGADHQRRRARMLPAAIGRPCPGCGSPMRAGAVDAAHSTDYVSDPTAKADHMRCASCNRREGGALGNRRAQFRPSRSW